MLPIQEKADDYFRTERSWAVLTASGCWTLQLAILAHILMNTSLRDTTGGPDGDNMITIGFKLDSVSIAGRCTSSETAFSTFCECVMSAADGTYSGLMQGITAFASLGNDSSQMISTLENITSAISGISGLLIASSVFLFGCYAFGLIYCFLICTATVRKVIFCFEVAACGAIACAILTNSIMIPDLSHNSFPIPGSSPTNRHVSTNLGTYLLGLLAFISLVTVAISSKVFTYQQVAPYDDMVEYYLNRNVDVEEENSFEVPRLNNDELADYLQNQMYGYQTPIVNGR